MSRRHRSPLKRKARRRFEQEGWTLIRGLLPPKICEPIKAAFLDEVKPYPGELMRQLTSVAEPHALNADGYVTNPVANPRTLTVFERFCSIETVAMTNCPLVMVVGELLGAAPGLLQCAYYESSRGTRTHLDFNPVDRSRPMVGVWIALEDIAPDAGRFFLYPHSHTLPDDERHRRFSELAWANYRQAFIELDPDTAEDEAQDLLTGILADHALDKVIPPLTTGDTVFWTNRILHGSDAPVPGGGSRHSLLFHFVELDLLREHGLVTS